MLNWMLFWGSIILLALLDRRYHQKQGSNNRLPQRPDGFNLPSMQNQTTNEYTPYHSIRPPRNNNSNILREIIANTYLTEDVQNLNKYDFVIHPQIQPPWNNYNNLLTNIYANTHLIKDEQNLNEDETPIINPYNELHRYNINDNESDYPYYFE